MEILAELPEAVLDELSEAAAARDSWVVQERR